jgi:aspartate/methionine/tyrosine aminotransferase
MIFNPNVFDCAPAPIAEAWSWVTNPGSHQLIDMCQAVPAHFPPQSLRDYLGEAIIKGEAAGYTDIRGILPLRQELAKNIESRYQGQVSADDIIITAGCNQAFCSVIDSLCDRGDEVIIPLPSYFNHLMWLSIRGINPKFLSFNAKTAMPDPEQAAALVSSRTRAIVLVTPNNPTGSTYSPECIEQFYALARSHNIALIVDETYRDFIDHQDTIHQLFKHHDWRKYFVHLYSFSKVFALTGHRTGAVVAGAGLLEQLRKIQDCTAICAPHCGQLAALYGLQNLHDWKLEKARELQFRAAAIRTMFEKPELKYRLLSAGAYFAYIEHPFDEPSRSVVKRLIQEFGLISLPGSYFGEQQNQFIRLAFANVSENRFEEVARRLIKSQK